MKNYYFTFGQNHWHMEGIPMKNFWVRVTAESYEKAREIFVEQFTEVYMQDANKFSFQYTEEEFSPELFPGAEFAHIKQS